MHTLAGLGQTNAVDAVGGTIYAGGCGNGCNPGGTDPFISGIDTNYGGQWHTINAPNLPNRIPTAFRIDPTDAAHVEDCGSSCSDPP